jgi:hypothetical protein
MSSGENVDGRWNPPKNGPGTDEEQTLEAEVLLVIRGRKKKRPNAPETSKKKHFERPNQGKKERKWSMEKFAAGCARISFEFHPKDDLKERIVKHATNAASSRRYQVADGPDFWQVQGTSTPVVPQASQTASGTSPDPGSLLPSRGGLVQFGGRVSGGPGAAGHAMKE